MIKFIILDQKCQNKNEKIITNSMKYRYLWYMNGYIICSYKMCFVPKLQRNHHSLGKYTPKNYLWSFTWSRQLWNTYILRSPEVFQNFPEAPSRSPGWRPVIINMAAASLVNHSVDAKCTSTDFPLRERKLLWKIKTRSFY